MNIETRVALIEHGLVFLAGLYALALGRRWVGKKPGLSVDYDRWHARIGRHLAWLGPVVCVCALLMLLQRVGR